MPPQTDQEKFGIYYGRVFAFKDYFGRNLPEKAAKGFDDQIYLSSYDWKKWTEEDLTKLATSYNGIDKFASLMYIKNSAVVKDADGKYTKEAIQAQNALTELKPDCCKNWKAFNNMLVRIEDAYKAQIIPLMEKKNLTIPEGYGALIDLHKNADIALAPMDNPAFDQQAALAALEKAGVKKDASDALKKPLETAVTDAVKGIKSAITLAA